MGDVPEADGLEPLAEAGSLVRFAGLVFDLDALTLARESGEAIRLTRGELAILHVFVTHPGRVISRDTLLDALANRRFEPFDRSVDVMVGKVRRKIEPNPRRPAIIVTVPGSGYKFAAAVRTQSPTTALKPEETGVDSGPGLPDRRHMTVLCAELLPAEGRTLPADLEDLHAAIDAFRRCVAEVLALYAGVIGDSNGREVVAYFGYPLAQENDAERAVRAALAIQRALSELNARNGADSQVELSARIGLESGPVMVDPRGEAFGNVATIAAQVRAAAPPHAVLVTRNVQRQIVGLFVAEEQGAHHFKDVSEPLSLYRVVRVSGGRRFGARMLTPLVGREEELELLARRWERARKGEGQFVLIIGEPGIGKSRLIEEFRIRLGETPHTLIEWSSSQLLQNSTLHPIVEWGRQRFGGADVSAERRLAELESTLAQIKLDPTENTPLLALLHDIPLPQERVPTLAPDELRRRQLAALTAAVMASARVQPVVLAIEDLHWADPTTVDVVKRIAEGGAVAPLFVVTTTRPEFKPPWSMRSHHTTITLAPLDRAEVHDMIAELSARHALPREVVDDVVARTGGVPLFIEEVTRFLLERGEHGSVQAIPPTLQQSLMARLDRLGLSRKVAQTGAVIGRGFSYALLRGVTGLEDAPLQAALDRLADADILLVQGVPPDSDYRFKHALIQDAAYENLLKSRRQGLHRHVAETLRDKFPAIAAAEPEVLAYHFGEAGLAAETCDYRMRAGDRATTRSAHEDAIEHFSAGLKSADSLPDPAERERSQLVFLVKLGTELMLVRGPQSDEVANAYARAVDIGEAIGDISATYKAKWGLWYNVMARGKIAQARERASDLIRYAERVGDDGFLIEARHCRFSAAFFGGDVARMVDDGRIGAKAYDIDRHRRLGPAFAGHDPGVCAHGVTGFGLQLSDASQEAEASVTRAVTLAEMLDHPVSMVHALIARSYVYQFRGDRELTFASVHRWAPIVEKLALYFYAPAVPLLTAWANATGSDVAGAARLVDKEIDKAATLGALPQYMLGLAGEVLLAAGRPGHGLAHLDRAIAMTEEPGVGLYLPEVYRLRGQCLLALNRNNRKEAQQAFTTARDIAKQQGATLFERRAKMALAELVASPIIE